MTRAGEMIRQLQAIIDQYGDLRITKRFRSISGGHEFHQPLKINLRVEDELLPGTGDETGEKVIVLDR